MSNAEVDATTPHRRGRRSNADSSPAGKSLGWWLMQLVTPTLVFVSGLAVVVAVGVAQRIGWISAGGGGPAAAASSSDQIYTCPMHPWIEEKAPGRCFICGMELVPATTSSSVNVDEFAVKIEPAQRRLAGIETAEVGREPLAATIETIGQIDIDESRMATIASYVDGRLERLFADYTGVDVAKNDHLAVVYSPELYAAQVEYVETRKSVANLSSGALDVVRQTQQKLLQNSRQRLTELGMQEAQVKELERTGQPQSRLTVFTPIGGTVIEKLAVEGKYIKAGEPIYRVADLSTVWLMLELYPDDATRVRFGQEVQAQVQSLPGEVFRGRIAFIDRTVDPRKRTVGVRVEFLNEERRLRPGDYANAAIYVPIGEQGEVYDSELAGRWISPMHPQIIRDVPGQCPICGMDLVPTTQYGYADVPVQQPASLYVPRSAVLMAGRSSVVYVETEPGRFEIRPVTIGPVLRDKVVIVAGLNEGEHVATAGNFLIDSQMQLARKPSLIDPTRAIAKQRERTSPMELDSESVTTVPGEAGSKLESLYAAYFRIQKRFAADQKPAEKDAHELRQIASSLASDPALPEDARQRIADVARQSEHIHHMPLDEARLVAFRPMSHAVVALAARVRGASAEEPLYHMFCPMVKGGAGDWLQADDKLVNPYWGSEMRECGEQVHKLPARGPAESPLESEDSPRSRVDSSSSGG